MLAEVTCKQTVQKWYHDVHSEVRQFVVGQKVWVENTMPKATEAKWLSETIVEKLGAVLYKVLVDNRVWKRYSDQIRAHLDHTLQSSPCPDDVDMLTEIPTSGESSCKETSVTGSSSELDTTSLGEQVPPTDVPKVLTQQPKPISDQDCVCWLEFELPLITTILLRAKWEKNYNVCCDIRNMVQHLLEFDMHAL